MFFCKWFKRFVLRCSLIKYSYEDTRNFLNEKQRRLQRGGLKNVSEIANVFKRK